MTRIPLNFMKSKHHLVNRCKQENINQSEKSILNTDLNAKIRSNTRRRLTRSSFNIISSNPGQKAYQIRQFLGFWIYRYKLVNNIELIPYQTKYRPIDRNRL